MSHLATETIQQDTTEPATIKALHWKLLFGNHRSELGDQGWSSLAKATGAPADVKSLGLAEDLPVAPFNDALAYLDGVLGTGDGAQVREIARQSVDRWATMYRTLVGQLEGRPAQMLTVLCEEVHPWFVNDEGASELLATGDEHAIVRLAGGLHPAFRAGLVEGFAELTGVEAEVEQLAEDQFHVTWSHTAAPAPSLTGLFVRATRLSTLPYTLAPILVGTALAWWQGHLDPLLATLAVAAAAALHMAANAFNDVVDHLRGVDPANLTPTPFSGGSRTLQLGLLGWREMVLLAGALGITGIGLGLWLVVLAGPAVLALGSAGVALGYAYSGAPFRLSERGLGELTAGLVFGPLMTAGAAAVQTGSLSVEGFVVGLPLGLSLAAQLLLNEIPDAPWDRRTGKRTLAVSLGDQVALGLAILYLGTGMSVISLVTSGFLPAASLAALAGWPLAGLIVQRVRTHRDDPEALVPYQGLGLVLHAATGILITGGLMAEVIL